jgi:hypothetical protein
MAGIALELHGDRSVRQGEIGIDLDGLFQKVPDRGISFGNVIIPKEGRFIKGIGGVAVGRPTDALFSRVRQPIGLNPTASAEYDQGDQGNQTNSKGC